MPDSSTLIRVVIVEDSQATANLLASILNAAGGIQVVGCARNGEEGVKMVQSLHPNLVTMDIYMPKMNGADAVRAIMRTHPVPIVIVSENEKFGSMDLSFQALRAGAITMIAKPDINRPETHQTLIQTVRVMAGVPVIHHWGTKVTKQTKPVAQSLTAVESLVSNKHFLSKIRVIGIAASTGGPSTIASVLKNLPADFPIPIALVQHFAPGFGNGLASWLNTQLSLKVTIASQGAALNPGEVLMAPDDCHIVINPGGKVEISQAPAYRGLRPSANPLFESLAKVYKSSALGIILTGMGDDGVDGLEMIHAAGGITIAQDEKSCIVYGMPRAAIARGAVDSVLNPEQIGFVIGQIISLTSKR